MQKGVLKLVGIVWGDEFLVAFSEPLSGSPRPLYDGVDGAVKYEITGLGDGETWTHYQPFSQKGMQQVNGRNVWGWDGNREAPTLTPSFVLDWGNGMRVHLFFTKGKINLLSDSTVTLEA
jgi:hypothetical protein